MGRGRKSSPPPAPKTYTQAEVDAMKTDWQSAADTKYDQRLAGQKELWGAQEAQRKSDYVLEQRNIYDDKLSTAKGEWRTAADKRYDARLGEARTGWHNIAEKQYGTRLDTAKSGWESEEEKRRAATQEEFNKKYGTLQGQYDTATGEYEDLQSKYGQLDKSYLESENRYGVLQGKYGDLEGRYNTRGREYDTLSSRYDDRGRTLNREQVRRRRGGFEAPSTAPTQSSPSDVSSDDKRRALLTGDYSFMQTDKGRSRGQGRDNSWQRYLG